MPRFQSSTVATAAGVAGLALIIWALRAAGYIDSPLDLVTTPYDAFNWLLDLVFLTVYGLFGRFGAPIVFIAALTEATAGLGMIFPGQQIMFIGGAAAGNGDGDIVVMVTLATVGTIIGDVVSYSLGRWWSDWLFRSRFGPHLRVGAALMAGRARWFIPLYHFYSVTRSVGPAAAGALRVPLRIWLPLDVLGAVIFNVVWVGAGYFFGKILLQPDGRLVDIPVVRIGLVVLAMLWFFVMQRMFEQRMRQMQALDAAEAAATQDATPGR